MDVLASECSSGCESGWTVYLEQSFLSPNVSHRNKGNGFLNGKSALRAHDDDDAEEEDDLSMVSDASSGPPHFQEEEEHVYFDDNNSCFCPKSTSKDVRLLSRSVGKRKKSREQRRYGGHEQLPTNFLDDTASSPVYNFSMVRNTIIRLKQLVFVSVSLSVFNILMGLKQTSRIMTLL